MPIAARHRDDPIPPLRTPEGFWVREETTAATMAALQGRPEGEIARRFADGHRAYVAWLHETPAAWGWVATRTAEIGELGTGFRIPTGERYLWNFVTLPAHRGLGIYPCLVDAIVRGESRQAARFWIAYAPENHASGSGVRKAGFVTLAELSFDAGGRPALQPILAGGDILAMRLLGLSRAAGDLSPCWRCVRAGRGATMTCRDGACRCDYQRPQMGCAA
jgi:ribosomal protein S18 acetylase RimI-like enzyme